MIISGVLCVIAFIKNYFIYYSWDFSRLHDSFRSLFKPIFWLLDLFGITHYLIADTIAVAIVSVLISFLISLLKKPSENRKIKDAEESYTEELKN